jgi:hypothetical protein
MRATSLGVRRIAAGAPGNHSYYSFSKDFKVLYSVCILIHVSLYVYIYVSINLHRVYLDWLQAVLERNRRYAWKRRSSEVGDTLEAVITRTWRRYSSELRDAHGGGDRVNLEVYLEV